jgi:hypothetical protein
MRDHVGQPRSEAADVDGARALAPAGLDDSFAAIARRAAVVAMVASNVMPIAVLAGSGRRRAIADDLGRA